MTTDAPSSRKRIVVARPIPLAPPVITATLPLSLMVEPHYGVFWPLRCGSLDTNGGGECFQLARDVGSCRLVRDLSGAQRLERGQALAPACRREREALFREHIARNEAAITLVDRYQVLIV